MDAGAREFEIPRLFLIQPTPAFGKPLAEEERGYVEATDEAAYRTLQDRLLRLRQESGVPVFSLERVFEGRSEPIYTDAIHVNALGNEIMAEAVAELIEREWGWERRRAGSAAERP